MGNHCPTATRGLACINWFVDCTEGERVVQQKPNQRSGRSRRRGHVSMSQVLQCFHSPESLRTGDRQRLRQSEADASRRHHVSQFDAFPNRPSLRVQQIASRSRPRECVASPSLSAPITNHRPSKKSTEQPIGFARRTTMITRLPPCDHPSDSRAIGNSRASLLLSAGLN